MSVPMEDLDDAFSEWDENAPIAQLARGSQTHVVPAISRTVTLEDPVTTALLATISRHAMPESVEEALDALAQGIPLLVSSP